MGLVGMRKRISGNRGEQEGVMGTTTKDIGCVQNVIRKPIIYSQHMFIKKEITEIYCSSS